MNVSFLLIKPDAVASGYVEEIIGFIKDRGFEVLERKQKKLSRRDAKFLYPMHIQEDFFDDLVAFMVSGFSVLLIVQSTSKASATKKLNKIVGATDPHENNELTLRKKFGTNLRRNAIHSPNTEANAVREILYFFTKWECDK